MGVTRRMAILVLCGVLLLWIGSFFGGALLLFIFYNCLLTALWIYDWRTGAKPGDFHVRRIHENRLEIGQSNTIGLMITCDAAGKVFCWVRDTVPSDIGNHDEILSIICNESIPVQKNYTVLPQKRGNYIFEDVYLRYQGQLGLYRGQVRIPCREEIPVYPDLQPLKKYRLLARKENLLQQDARTHRVVGTGTDFVGLREYNMDDEVRHINWSATARYSKLITNQYDVEKSQNIIIAIDTGRMMLQRASGMTRLDHAVQSALVLAQVALDRGDRVGLVLFHHEVNFFVKPAAGKEQMEKILKAVYAVQPCYFESDLSSLVSYLGVYQRKRSLVCIFSQVDGIEKAKEIAALLQPLKDRHALLLITLLNPGLQQLIDAPVENLEGAYRKASAVYGKTTQAHVSGMLNRMGIPSILTIPRDLAPEVVNRYIILRKQMKL